MTMNIPPNATGPWGLVDLQKELGSAKNEGRIERQQYAGGETELTQEYGPFRFSCGCSATKSGVSGDLYLVTCSPSHGQLKPSWTP
jgi:hypothetical protein